MLLGESADEPLDHQVEPEVAEEDEAEKECTEDISDSLSTNNYKIGQLVDKKIFKLT